MGSGRTAFHRKLVQGKGFRENVVININEVLRNRHTIHRCHSRPDWNERVR